MGAGVQASCAAASRLVFSRNSRQPPSMLGPHLLLSRPRAHTTAFSRPASAAPLTTPAKYCTTPWELSWPLMPTRTAGQRVQGEQEGQGREQLVASVARREEQLAGGMCLGGSNPGGARSSNPLYAQSTARSRSHTGKLENVVTLSNSLANQKSVSHAEE